MPDWIKILADKDIIEGGQDDWCCPNCGWEIDPGYLDDEEPFMGYAVLYGYGMFIETRRYATTNNPYDSFGSATWIEKWRCPECGTIWEYENCNF